VFNVKEYSKINKKKIQKYHKKYYHIHKQELKERRKKYNQNPIVKNKRRKRRREYYKKNKIKFAKKSLDYYYRIREKNIMSRKERKMEVINGYDGKCVCCGEANWEFLTVDHIKNDGAEERKKMTGNQFYEYIIKNNFPKKYRLLCSNCNWSRGTYGYCPHEKEAK